MAENPLTSLLMLPGNPSVTQYNQHVHSTESILSKSVAGSAHITLTELEASHALIILTGALTGNIEVRVPQKERRYRFVNATTGAFTIIVQPVTSGTGVFVDHGQYTELLCDGTNVTKDGFGMATFAESNVHLVYEQSGGSLFLDWFFASTSGVGITARHARGTYLVPVFLNSGDATFSVNAFAWGRDAGNAADVWFRVGRYRIVVDSKDAQGRMGGRHEWYVSPGVSAADVERMRLTEAGLLLLGNISTGTDIVSLSAADILGVAGEHGLQITDETGVITSIGKGLLSRKIVEANTAGSGAPNVLVVNESGKVLTNEGATARNYHTLPSAVAGLTYSFYVQDTDGIRIVASTGDTIRIAATVSASAGFAEATTVGNAVTLQAINATEWVALSVIGTWTVT